MMLFPFVARTSFRRHSTYRMAAAAAVLENTFVSLLRGLVYAAVVRTAGDVGAFDQSDALTFAFLAGMIESSFWVVAPTEIGERIRSGDVVIDLYRPVDFQLWWLASEAGRCGFNLLARGLAPVLVAFLAFDPTAPSPATFAWFLASLVLAFVLIFAWKFLVSLTGFWLLDVRGVTSLAGALVTVASGGLLPLALLPDGIARVLRWLPPASMINTPIELFLGGHAVLPRLALQAAWAVVVLLIGRIVLGRAVAKLVVQGG